MFKQPSRRYFSTDPVVIWRKIIWELPFTHWQFWPFRQVWAIWEMAREGWRPPVQPGPASSDDSQRKCCRHKPPKYLSTWDTGISLVKKKKQENHTRSWSWWQTRSQRRCSSSCWDRCGWGWRTCSRCSCGMSLNRPDIEPQDLSTPGVQCWPNIFFLKT